MSLLDESGYLDRLPPEALQALMAGGGGTWQDPSTGRVYSANGNMGTDDVWRIDNITAQQGMAGPERGDAMRRYGTDGGLLNDFTATGNGQDNSLIAMGLVAAATMGYGIPAMMGASSAGAGAGAGATFGVVDTAAASGLGSGAAGAISGAGSTGLGLSQSAGGITGLTAGNTGLGLSAGGMTAAGGGAAALPAWMSQANAQRLAGLLGEGEGGGAGAGGGGGGGLNVNLAGGRPTPLDASKYGRGRFLRPGGLK